MLQIRDDEIRIIEKMLLPNEGHFSEDAKAVIQCWESKDVAACPGSGKTTVLLAKLKLLSERMPFDNGTGICVLSHTNVAVNEIKTKMTEYAGKLMCYPNYVGTIQSFIDQFVTMPYIKQKFGKTVQAVDERTYSEHLYNIVHSGKYGELTNLIKIRYRFVSKQYADEADFIGNLYSRSDGSLCIGQNKLLAGADKESAVQFKLAMESMITKEGLIKYTDAYKYASEAVEELTSEFTNLFSCRFRYVFVDEYQDCNENQKNALAKLFDYTKCCVFRIGDPDQAIYSSDHDNGGEWKPMGELVSLEVSNRYGQEIADVLHFLRTGQKEIIASSGKTGYRPVLFVYDKNCISEVLGQFIIQLDKHGLMSKEGVYKAIGNVRNDNASGIKIGEYWHNFDGVRTQRKSFSYWAFIDEICGRLIEGNLYIAELRIRKLICCIFHYTGITNARSGKKYTPHTLKQKLDTDFFDVYRDALMEIVSLSDYTQDIIDIAFRNLIDKLFSNYRLSGQEIMKKLPSHFMEKTIEDLVQKTEKNVFIDPTLGRRIQFDTVHGVKGETHDATLYLETETNRSSDIVRVLPCFGVGKPGTSRLYERSRKLVYVGMSRPKKLLCLAVQESTYIKGKNFFQNWDIVDLRKNGKP